VVESSDDAEGEVLVADMVWDLVANVYVQTVVIGNLINEALHVTQ
jgi:hypothetical protein